MTRWKKFGIMTCFILGAWAIYPHFHLNAVYHLRRENTRGCGENQPTAPGVSRWSRPSRRRVPRDREDGRARETRRAERGKRP